MNFERKLKASEKERLLIYLLTQLEAMHIKQHKLIIEEIGVTVWSNETRAIMQHALYSMRGYAMGSGVKFEETELEKERQ